MKCQAKDKAVQRRNRTLDYKSAPVSGETGLGTGQTTPSAQFMNTVKSNIRAWASTSPQRGGELIRDMPDFTNNFFIKTIVSGIMRKVLS